MATKKKLAIIGSGIAAMTAGYLLRDTYEITVFEKEKKLGGHLDTVYLEDPQQQKLIALDLGFMVFNHKTYPLLSNLYRELDILLAKSDMSWSYQNQDSSFAFSGKSFLTLFSPLYSIFSFRKLYFFKQAFDFNRKAASLTSHVNNTAINESLTLEKFLIQHDYSNDFMENYIFPMCSAIWSISIETVKQIPAYWIFTFFKEHGFISLKKKLNWYCNRNGAGEFLEKLVIKTRYKQIFTDCQVTKIVPKDNQQFKIHSISCDRDNLPSMNFDKVIIGTPMDVAVELLAFTNLQSRKLLSKFKYISTSGYLHTDSSLMPKNKRLWSSWNFLKMSRSSNTKDYLMTYHLNRLQAIKGNVNYFLTLGNALDKINPQKIIKPVQYRHFIPTADSLKTQKKWHDIQLKNIFFVGSYFRNGFHEDAVASVYDLLASHEF